MSVRKLLLATVLAFLVETLVGAWVPLWGVRPRLLPALAVAVGFRAGPQWGAACGLLGGSLCTLAGASPFQMVLLTLAGGIGGELFHKSAWFWGKWLACWGILGGMEALLVLGHLLAGADLWGALRVAGPELLWSAGLFPPVWALTGAGPRARRIRQHRF